MERRSNPKVQLGNGHLATPANIGKPTAVETKSASLARANRKFAECDDIQSGQRFLNSSAPRLIRHVASCETAAGGEIPLTAGKEEKLFRGPGQSPAIRSRREAPGSFTPSPESGAVLPYALDDCQITALLQFFATLDRWDREAHGPQVM